jgi:hypothetical protein
MLRKFLIFLLPALLFGMEGRVHDITRNDQVWLTGPLITPSAVIVQNGHIDVEPYVYVYANSDNYNRHWNLESKPTFWTVSSQTLIQVGITPWMDVAATPVFNWSHVNGASAWSLGDLILDLDFQFYRNKFPTDDSCPSIRFTLTETVPLGRYRNLDPKKRFTDVGGAGSWATSAEVGCSNIARAGNQFFVYRFNLQFNYLPPLHVKGFHAYGGGFGTDGTIYPGVNGIFNAGFEYTLSQNWALALDLVGKWFAKNRFSGKSGLDQFGHKAFNGGPSGSQYSLAPAIEYNWSVNLGIIAGVWFSVAGKNITQFNSIVVALNYYK